MYGCSLRIGSSGRVDDLREASMSSSSPSRLALAIVHGVVDGESKGRPQVHF